MFHFVAVVGPVIYKLPCSLFSPPNPTKPFFQSNWNYILKNGYTPLFTVVCVSIPLIQNKVNRKRKQNSKIFLALDYDGSKGQMKEISWYL